MKRRQLSTASQIVHSIFALWCAFLDIVFPPRCLSCKKESSYFCESCRGRLPENNTIGIRGVISLWNYDNRTVRDTLWQLKFHGKTMLAKDLASSLYDKILETIAEEALYQNPIGGTGKYLIVPIPVSKKRMRKRGYNQAELLAKALSEENPGLFIFENEALIKIKETESQVSVKNREKRLKNLHGAFEVAKPERVRGKNVIVVDDVATTGATMAEARKVLLKAGAKRVLGATIAH